MKYVHVTISDADVKTKWQNLRLYLASYSPLILECLHVLNSLVFIPRGKIYIGKYTKL
jgi:hypothetical protein